MATALLTFSSLKGTNIFYEATTQKTSLHVSQRNIPLRDGLISRNSTEIHHSCL